MQNDKRTVNRRNLLRTSAALATAAMASSWPAAGAAIAAGEPASAGVANKELRGIRLTLGRPRVVAESSGKCWYPDLLRFSSGELMLTHSLNEDLSTNAHNSQAVYISRDEGQSFNFQYDVNGFHNGGGEPRISLPDGRIVGTSTFLRPDGAGQRRRFKAHHITYDRGGKRYAVEPWGALVSGLPHDVFVYQPNFSRTWWARINWFSDIIPLEGGRWISTISLQVAGDKRETTVAVISRDEGHNWEYLSTIAGPDAVPDAEEGVDEPCLVRLADGDLMFISRVGAGEKQRLARTYSGDGGRTWTPIDRLPAYSVAPQVNRLKNGVLALSTGRPGLFLWLSTDARGQKWQSVDILAHHNAMVAAPYQMVHKGIADLNTYQGPAIQTTAYTALLEIEANRLLLVYDRMPLGWRTPPAGYPEKSRIYLVEINVQRVT